MNRPLTGKEKQLVAAVQQLPTEPKACTKCSTPTSLTEDWTLWPWPDGAWLCTPCNEARHKVDDFDAIEAKSRES